MGFGKEAHVRGIRPELRFGLLAADAALTLAAVGLATSVSDVHSSKPYELLELALLLFVCGAYFQFRFESARTFDFHDVLRLLGGAIGGTLLALLLAWVIPSPLWHISGRLVAVAALLAFE